MDHEKLKKIMEEHVKYLARQGGVRADFRGADLREAHLWDAHLEDANLRGANLRGANLRGAHLEGANLEGANMWGADLREAHLWGAHLEGANLEGANMWGADLREAHLWDAHLEDANLRGANLRGAHLQNTCLDPENVPNGRVTAFERTPDGLIIGYRTRKAGHIDRYRVGRHYSADFFSTADTECHPGLYLCPTIEDARKHGEDIIMVHTRPEHVHQAGKKYRCREFFVVKEV